MLILCFELETGILAGRLGMGGRRWAIRGVRLLCYVAIFNTSFGNARILRDVESPRHLPAAANLCDYTDGSWSFLRNRDYTYIDTDNCATIGSGPEFFAIDPEPVITDRAGLDEALILGWTDLIESISWLLIVFANESVIRMQARGITGGNTMTLVGGIKIAFYAVILGTACYWGSKQQYLYIWDELLWICGFFVIENNLIAQRVRLRAGISSSSAA